MVPEFGASRGAKASPGAAVLLLALTVLFGCGSTCPAPSGSEYIAFDERQWMGARFDRLVRFLGAPVRIKVRDGHAVWVYRPLDFRRFGGFNSAAAEFWLDSNSCVYRVTGDPMEDDREHYFLELAGLNCDQQRKRVDRWFATELGVDLDELWGDSR